MTRLSDLYQNFLIYAVCAGCERMCAVPMPALVETLGLDATVTDVRQRVRCHRCDRRTEDIRVVYVGPHGDAGEFRYRSNSVTEVPP